MAARVTSMLPALEPRVLASRFISWNRKSRRLPALPAFFLPAALPPPSVSRWRSSSDVYKRQGYWFVDKVTAYAKERMVFGRPIGQNQGVQFPIARAHINVEAASLMRYEACRLFDAHEPCGAQANMAKLLAADASWEAANACLQFHGGFGFATEYDVERKFRETRLYQVAPISTNLILSYVAEHILGLPRSF